MVMTSVIASSACFGRPDHPDRPRGCSGSSRGRAGTRRAARQPTGGSGRPGAERRRAADMNAGARRPAVPAHQPVSLGGGDRVQRGQQRGGTFGAGGHGERGECWRGGASVIIVVSCSARRSRGGWCTVARPAPSATARPCPGVTQPAKPAGQVPGPAIKQIYRETGRRNRDHIVEEFASVARMIR